ncbi:hypothetical protein PT285_09850 [Lactobacillus sp. ESL0791]|uniref:hypothetical protein n=1 Tax=Lactobacillus sp. ESL0791 TaxID=2983234 RepID=UPI0023F6FE0E|nr:hypothetical protein [Lactobacillus sp. ESL0791]MDF7639703.1 hypothetical protein [Lactobacillus sp. ESL0791]
MEKFEWMKRYIQAADGTAEKGIAEDKLTELGIIPAQPIVDDSNWDDFWNQFKR